MQNVPATAQKQLRSANRGTHLSQVLHLNVRLNEGGAAGVARTLAEEMTQFGLEVVYAYGYGPHGKSTDGGTSFPTMRLTPRLVAGLNLAAHQLLGRETRARSHAAWTALAKAIEDCDIVHLHVLHSYFLSVPALLKLIREARKPVVWTLHDQWIMTGRCAQPGSCRGWETGCQSCPDLSAYPPAKLDRAAHNRLRRIDYVQALQRSVPTAFVACASWLAAEASSSGLCNTSVITNSVDREFWSASQKDPLAQHKSDRPTKVVFICRDLRDKAKVDWNFLAAVAAQPDIRLTIVGDHAPTALANATHISAVSNRTDLASILQIHHILLFTSKVDYYPLTIAEAVTAGIHTLALDSPAAREFSTFKSVTVATTTEEMLALLRQRSNWVGSTRRERALFAPNLMAEQYLDTYHSLLKRPIL